MFRGMTVIVFTTRMTELAEFYARAFDLGPPQTHDRHVGYQVGPIYLGFDQVDTERGHGAVTLWFPVDDVDATFARCVELGARVHYEPVDKPWGDRLAAVYDPDGNLVGISRR